jgi:hypothetical protein
MALGIVVLHDDRNGVAHVIGKRNGEPATDTGQLVGADRGSSSGVQQHTRGNEKIGRRARAAEE